MKPALPLRDLPWLTPDGIDLTLVPIDSVLRQAVSPDRQSFRNGCSVLRAMAQDGRDEATVFLLGLLTLHRLDLDRLLVVVESLEGVQTEQVAAALFAELRRLPSNNSTRRYLGVVIRLLARFPSDLVAQEFETLADEQNFSQRMRRKFRETALGMRF